ncbi:MAG: monovalent cation/H(+) antiporter subunit G [Oscillospiraceae bacterium]|nr:monovalent cation/H(+) antiporter subunit G [Oscillospiraceae bacterium]
MIRLILSALFILAGVIVIITALVGNYRFSYVLNRMQIGATADTMGAILVLIGLIIKCGLNMISVKLFIMIIFFWGASPVCSHFLARTEAITNKDILDECEVVKHDNI